MRFHEEYIQIEKHQLYSKRIVLDDAFDNIVFLHEGLGCTELWKDFPEKLCRSLNKNALIYDRRGYGRSSHHDFSNNPRYMHEEALNILPQVLEYYSIDVPILYGHSDGGTIALIFAANYHEQTKAVITEAAHSHREEIGAKGIQKTVKYFDLVLRQKLLKFHKENTDAIFSGWSGNWLSDAFEEWNIFKELASINCPVLVLQGENDRYATQEHAKIISDKIINAYSEYRLIPNADHAPHKENFPEVEKVVLTFLAI